MMNARRWIAIGAAVVLLFVSLGFQLVFSALSATFSEDLTETVSFDDIFVSEETIQDGSLDERIAVLELDGVIQDVGSGNIFSEMSYDHQLFLEQIETAKEDETVKAILFKVNSPGGGVSESAEIHQAILDLQEESDKPIYVSMGDMAASGGYYVAAPADKIYAQKTTLTGSIGVIMQNINYAKLAEKYGVDFNTIKSGKHKDILSPSREMTDEEHQIMQSIIDEMFDEFVSIIVDGRDMKEKEVRGIADGRIYTGNQAKEINLVDEVGSFDDALGDLQKSEGLEDAEVFSYSKGMSFLNSLSMRANMLFMDQENEFLKLINLLADSNSPRAMYLYSN